MQVKRVQIVLRKGKLDRKAVSDSEGNIKTADQSYWELIEWEGIFVWLFLTRIFNKH